MSARSVIYPVRSFSYLLLAFWHWVVCDLSNDIDLIFWIEWAIFSLKNTDVNVQQNLRIPWEIFFGWEKTFAWLMLNLSRKSKRQTRSFRRAQLSIGCGFGEFCTFKPLPWHGQLFTIKSTIPIDPLSPGFFTDKGHYSWIIFF